MSVSPNKEKWEYRNCDKAQTAVTDDIIFLTLEPTNNIGAVLKSLFLPRLQKLHLVESPNTIYEALYIVRIKKNSL